MSNYYCPICGRDTQGMSVCPNSANHLVTRNPSPHAAPPSVPSSPTVHLDVVITDVRQTAEYSFGYQQALQDLSSVLPGTYYMDPPDGGSVTVIEQLQRMARDAERYRSLRDAPNTKMFWIAHGGLGNLSRWTGSNADTEIDAAIQSAARGEES